MLLLLFGLPQRIPTAIPDGDTADVQVKALSKTFSDDGQTSPNAGAVVSGQGDANTDAVLGTNDCERKMTMPHLL